MAALDFWSAPVEDYEYYAVLNVPRDATDEDVRRAYRNLAQLYHPDKHTDPELKEKAQEAFRKLQEAYEVLSDPGRRQIYDVYGKAGLEAGFELGSKLDSVDELKKKWDEFRSKQESERVEALSNHRGTYTCRVDASDLAASLAGQRPLFRAVAAANSVDVPLGEADVLSVTGSATLRNNVGAGNLICGYRRVLSPHDTLDGSLVMGLRSALSLTSTRQLTPYTTGSLTSTYHVGGGWGMQLSSTRQLPYNMQATLGWVVGPSAASGINLSLTKRGTKYSAWGKVELGAATSLSARLSYQLRPSLTLRAAARLGSTGVDMELGAGRKWDSSTAGYLGAVVGLQGVVVKARVTRGGQALEVPVVIGDRFTDLRAVAAAYILPPLAYLAISRCIVRPLIRWRRQRREQKEQAEHGDDIRAARQQAAAECSLIDPVARRKARAEAAKRPAGGLVVLDAVYGNVESYTAEGGPQQQAVAAAASSGAAAEGAAEGAAAAAPSGAPAAAVEAASASGRGGEAGLAGEAGSSSGGRLEPGAADSQVAAAAEQQPPPPPWLNVATALQYLVTDSRLVLHPGVPKKNQMGFADPTPGASSVRRLYVAYLYGSQVYEVTVDDTQALQLPGAGEAVADAARAQGLLRLGAAALRVPELLLPPGSGGAAAGGDSLAGTPAPSPRVGAST